MIKSYNFLVLIVMFANSIELCGQSNINNNSDIKTYLDNMIKKDFSGSILVAKDDSIIERRAYGLASIEFNVENNIDTKFNIASITKMFTSVATLQLYEKGKVQLNQPIGKYLPNYPNKVVRDSVTIHQLLTHTAGTNNFLVGDFLSSGKLQYKNVKDFLPLFVDEPLLFSPGSDYNYSAAGFVILGLIIEKVSGDNYYEFVKDNIFIPASMNHTTELEIDSIVKNKAVGYTSLFGENEILKRNDYYLSKADPAGFHYSTVDDLFNFSKALRNYQLLGKVTTELMFAPKVKGFNTHLGYGIDVDQRYNQTILGHSGGWYGVRCELMDFMDSNYTIIVLSNIDDDGKTGASKVIDSLKELIAGLKKEQ